LIYLIDNQAKKAAEQFQTAWEAASKLPAFDETARLTFKQRLAFASIRLGDGATAERLFRELIAAFSRTSGPDSPSVLRVRLNLAQAFMIGGKNREAIDEANRIYPEYVARLGEDHELTMQLLTWAPSPIRGRPTLARRCFALSAAVNGRVGTNS
jgi:hypothetical protein